MLSSSSEVPTETPCEARKVKHMPPPMTRLSAFVASDLDDRQLVGHLGAAEHHRVRPLGRAGQLLEHLDLGGHQLARVVRQQGRDVVHRGLLAVHHPEAVGDERAGDPSARRPVRPAALASASRSSSSLLVSRGSKRMFSSSRTSPSVRPSARASASEPDHVAGQLDVPAQLLAQRRRDGGERELRVRAALGPAEVRGDDDLGAGVGQRLQRRHRGDDPARVGDVAVVVERDVEVGAHQHAPARNPFCE